MACCPEVLYSTVRNVSGHARAFSFLPPHGRIMAIDEEVSVFGDIREAVNRGDRFGNRWMKALENALCDNKLDIVNTPAPVFQDATDGLSKVLAVDDGELVIALNECAASESVSW